jgi:hypothetical protein
VVRVTEGELKAYIAMLRTGIPTLGCPGVGAWRLAISEAVERNASCIRLAFDSDWPENEQVARSIVACARRVIGLGLELEFEIWDAAHKGIDDALLARAKIEVAGDEAAVPHLLEVASRHAIETAVSPQDLDGWISWYAGRNETAYLHDPGLVAALGECKAHDPARLARIRARFKDAGFAVASFDDVVKATARNQRVSAANERRQRKAEACGDDQRESDDHRAEIQLDAHEKRVADQVLDVLRCEPNLYYRGDALVHVVEDRGGRPECHQPQRQAGSPRVCHVVPAKMRELIATHCLLTGFRKIDGVDVPTPVNVPRWLPEAILARGTWFPGLRGLVGIVEAPTLREDGSILADPGYDEATGLLYRPSAEFPAVPESPAEDDARAGCRRLIELVDQFPFVDANHRAAFLSALLTLVARPGIAGSLPMHLFDGNAPGVGKSLLADLCGIIATGRELPRYTYAACQTELAKQLLAISVAGDSAILFDNAETGAAIGGPALDQAITASSIRGRILGQTRMVTMPWHAVIYVTANNVHVAGDAHRRSVLCRLESQAERPEERSGFKIPDLVAHVRTQRPQLLIDALTILHAYHAAGRPKPDGFRPLGGFGAWSDLVRGAVIWVTGNDPIDTRAELSVADQEAGLRQAFLLAWENFATSEFEPRTGRDGLTVAEVLGTLRADKEEKSFPEMRAVLAELASRGTLPSSRSLGKWLSKIRHRTIDSKRLTSKPDSATSVMRWAVQSIPSTPTQDRDRRQTNPGNPGNPDGPPVESPSSTPTQDRDRRQTNPGNPGNPEVSPEVPPVDSGFTGFTGFDSSPCRTDNAEEGVPLNPGMTRRVEL